MKNTEEIEDNSGLFEASGFKKMFEELEKEKEDISKMSDEEFWESNLKFKK